jgi:ABC-type Fe3+ transport system substrate-binding protein
MMKKHEVTLPAGGETGAGVWMRGAAASVLAMVLATTSLPASAQDVDPAHAEGWAFMQQQMPGVPYDLLKAACAEGEMMIYSGTWPDATQAVIDGFKARFPCIDAQSFVTQTGPRRERFLTEWRAGKDTADIIQDTDPGTLESQIEEGYLLQYRVSNDDKYPDALKHSDYWYPIRIAIMGIAWNTDLVSEEDAKELLEWKSLTDPKWKGKVGVSDPSSGGAAFLPWYLWPKLFGDEFMQKFAALDPRGFTSVNPTISSLASGDIEVYAGADDAFLTGVWDQGAPIHWSLPDPGIGVPTGQAISAHAPHPNAAKLYQEYMFSEEGYGLWQKIGGGPSVRHGFADQRAVAKEPWYHFPDELYQYDRTDATKAKDAVVEMYHKLMGT